VWLSESANWGRLSLGGMQSDSNGETDERDAILGRYGRAYKKVREFIRAWGPVGQELGCEPSIEEFARWWRVSEEGVRKKHLKSSRRGNGQPASDGGALMGLRLHVQCPAQGGQPVRHVLQARPQTRALPVEPSTVVGHLEDELPSMSTQANAGE
jgi:hypothetical protein